jgi:hypothetical protein
MNSSSAWPGRNDFDAVALKPLTSSFDFSSLTSTLNAQALRLTLLTMTTQSVAMLLAI